MFGRQPLSYANVVASLALFVALGGTAAAAVTLDRDSVGSREIRDGAVRSAGVVGRAPGEQDSTGEAEGEDGAGRRGHAGSFGSGGRRG